MSDDIAVKALIDIRNFISLMCLMSGSDEETKKTLRFVAAEYVEPALARIHEQEQDAEPDA